MSGKGRRCVGEGKEHRGRLAGGVSIILTQYKYINKCVIQIYCA